MRRRQNRRHVLSSLVLASLANIPVSGCEEEAASTKGTPIERTSFNSNDDPPAETDGSVDTDSEGPQEQSGSSSGDEGGEASSGHEVLQGPCSLYGEHVYECEGAGHPEIYRGICESRVAHQVAAKQQCGSLYEEFAACVSMVPCGDLKIVPGGWSGDACLHLKPSHVDPLCRR